MENERILYTECPLCTSADFTHLTNARATGHARWREPLEPFIAWMECRDCGHVFTNGYFTEAAFTPIHYAISERYRGCMEVLAKAA